MVSHITEVSGAGPTLYLTFDDGPRFGHYPWELYRPDQPEPQFPERVGTYFDSEALVERLRRHGAMASFFTIGWRLDQAMKKDGKNWPALLLKDGHAVSNHTYHHPPDYPVELPTNTPLYRKDFLDQLPAAALRDTIYNWEQCARELVPGAESPSFRYFRGPHDAGMRERPPSAGVATPPGEDNPALVSALTELDMAAIVGWKITGGDGVDPIPPSATIRDNVLNGVKHLLHPSGGGYRPDAANGAIILLHESSNTVLALHDILTELSQEGRSGWAHPAYRFAALGSGG